METGDSQLSVPVEEDNDKKPKTHVWIRGEERHFVGCLKKAKACGLKAKNGWKPGYLLFLCGEMQKKFPNTNLKPEPHIKSKMKAWKKDYGFLQTILEKSGIVWDSTKVVKYSDDIWKHHTQAYKGMGLKKDHVWPFYEYWIEIFGKDRATGKGAKSLREAAAKFLPENLLLEKDKMSIAEVIGGNLTELMGDEVASSANTKRPRAGNSNQVSDVDNQLVGIINAAFNKAVEALPPMKRQKVDSEPDSWKTLHEAISKCTSITLRDKVAVGTKLAKDPDLCAYFLSLPEDWQEEFIVQQLELVGVYRPSFDDSL